MIKEQTQKAEIMQPGTVKFLSLGGVEDVTRNMYLYEFKDQILIVDCGIGFPDETMLGVDLLLPDITYLLHTCMPEGKAKKKIVGMLLTHGHEDHIGGLPFILPQLPSFPIYGSPLTAALANEKLTEFNTQPVVQTVRFTNGNIQIGDFKITFIHVTHSIPDTTHLFIETPVGNFYHGADYKFDLTPADRKRAEFLKIAQAAQKGITALLSDCLGAERPGFTPSEEMLTQNFEKTMRECQGKVFITTNSSNVSRLNQAIEAAEKLNRKVCFVGRSIIKAKQIAQKLGYLHIKRGTEIQIEALPRYKSNQVMLLVAGSQGQENSAMNRIAEGEHKAIGLQPNDMVIFSADPIPGNELAVSSLVDSIAKKGATVIYSDIASGSFHVSGHGSSGDHMLLISLTQPKFLLPISGTYRHMIAYRDLCEKMNYKRNQIFLIENGQEVVFTAQQAKIGKKIEVKNVYIDEVSGEELESYVVRDRERLAQEGALILLVEINASNSQLARKPEVIMRGTSLSESSKEDLEKLLQKEIAKVLSNQKGHVTNWVHIRRVIGDVAESHIFKKLHSQPLILPVVIEV
ncbi:MAG: ribonuclease J [Chloroflexi bacterium]|nr:MAG: ribonuclease J [Chloroflexota bacterium]